MGLQIYANIDATSLATGRVQNANDLRSKSFKQLAAGDSTVVDLFLTGQNGLQDIQTYPTVRLGIGSINARPTGGTWDLGAQTGLAFDISAAALDTAITAEVAACTVTQITDFVYKVVFTANGDQTIPTVDATGLTPSSTVSINTLVAGDGSTPEQWIIRIFKNPIALIDSNFTNIAGSGIRGALNLGTEGIYELLGTSTSASTTIELELTDASGDIQTIFQAPLTITGEVIGQGVTGVAAFNSYATTAEIVAGFEKDNTIFVAKNGSDATGTVGRFDLPFLTGNAAEDAASSGDTIIVFPGDYSGESALGGVDGVTYQGLDGAILPSFNVTTAITVKGSGLCQSVEIDNASCVLDLDRMNTVANASCLNGTLTLGNVGGNITTVNGTSKCKDINGIASCTGGTQNIYGDITGSADCEVGTQNIFGSVGSFIFNSDGNQNIFNSTQSHDGTTWPPIELQFGANLTIKNSRSESTELDGEVVNIANNWSGTLKMIDCELVTENADTNSQTIGIQYGTSVTGNVQLKNCTIITAEDGTGTAKSIDAPSAQTVYIQGSLNQTHDEDADITFEGGSTITNTNFTA